MKAIRPLYIEAELGYTGGKAAEFDAGGTDKDLEGWGGYIKAQGNFGPAFVGFQYGYASGDDGADSEKTKTYPMGGGTSWNPAMLLLNDDLNTWGSGGATTSPTGITSKKLNMMLANLYAGFKVTPKLIDGSITWASQRVADHWDEIWDSNSTCPSPKIYDNLSYMAGAAYLVTATTSSTALPARDRQRLPADQQADAELLSRPVGSESTFSTRPGERSPGLFLSIYPANRLDPTASAW